MSYDDEFEQLKFRDGQLVSSDNTVSERSRIDNPELRHLPSSSFIMADTNPEIEALIDEYGEGTVRAAFAIAQSIGNEAVRNTRYSGCHRRLPTLTQESISTEDLLGTLIKTAVRTG